MNARPLPVTELLTDLRERGIEIRPLNGRIRFRPKSAMTPDLAERIDRLRCEIIANYEAVQDPFTVAVMRAFGGEVVNDASWPSETAPFHEPPVEPDRCRGCRGRRWWRRRAGGPRACERCHPCPYPDDAVERGGNPS